MKVLIVLSALLFPTNAPASLPSTMGFWGEQLVKQYEGLVLCKYIDAAGFPTIGYGHLIKKGEEIDECISIEKANELLRSDLRGAERSVVSIRLDAMSQGEFDALTSLIYNIGIGRFGRSKASMYLDRCDVYNFKIEAFDSEVGFVKAGGRTLLGLVLRRQAELLLFES